ncbi:MAG: CPBP family intramembrane glutamic endopeptidase [Patescibacteria group bacterium]|nr:CPBP family intramembrane glutamic endopeptidase [Patescibacteria group bacterium]
MPFWMDGAAVAVAALLPTVVTVVYFLGLAASATWVQQTAWALGKSVQFGFPLFWVLVVQRARWRGDAPWLRGVGAGAVSGVLILAGMLAAYHLWLGPAGAFDGPAVAMRAKLVGMGLDSPARFIAFAVFLSVVHSWLEEYYFRWFLFGQMRQLMPTGLAMGLSSGAFASHHIFVLAVYFGWTSPLTWFFVAGVAVGGAIWAWLYERTGSLLGPWLSHLLADVGILLVGYRLLMG